MQDTLKVPQKLSFSGHDTFHCRHLWLKKGYEFVRAGGKFSNEDAVVTLGVGKNMVSAISYWMKAFGVLDKEGSLTTFADYIFGENGKDPYLEDEATLWLLHYQLVTQKVASIYSLVFNEFRREKIEFTKEQFTGFVSRKAETEGLGVINVNTVAADFEVLKRMYIKPEILTKDREENFAGLLTELDLIQEEQREIDKKKVSFYYVNTEDKPEIPDEVLLYCILDKDGFDKSVSVNTLVQEYDFVGSVLALGKMALSSKVDAIAKNKQFKQYGIVFNDYAGLKELQFGAKPNKFDILNLYYGN
jgi:Protein of unknown function (DUF4007)